MKITADRSTTLSRETLTKFTDAAAAAVAREIATLRREAARERESFAAEMRAVRAEWEARLAALAETERRLADRIAALKDGAPGRDGVDGNAGADGISVSAEDVLPALLARADAAVAETVERVLDGWARPKDGRDGAAADPEVVRALVVEAVAAIPAPKDGKDGRDGADGQDGAPGRDGADGASGRDADPEVTANLVRAEVARAVAEIPAPKDGADGASVTLADVAPLIVEEVGKRMGEHAQSLSAQLDAAVAAIPVPKDGADGKDGERGPEGPAGKLPVVREWADGVFYAGDVVTQGGGVFQAKRDTGKAPGHDDWLCIVERGKDGADGRSFAVCGTYAPEADYHALDVVALNGASFAAKRDKPGACPGDGWQMIAMQGRQGKPGAAGPRGNAAVAVAATVKAARISDEGMLTLVNADGSEVECDLYPVLSRLG